MKEESRSVNLETTQLRDRLNRVYSVMKSRRNLCDSQAFFALWDLKEQALLENKTSVCVPATWLDRIVPETSVINH
jgi:hypothetical protein